MLATHRKNTILQYTTHPYIYIGLCICYSYTTGMSALPEIHTQARGPQARGHVRILTGNAQVPAV